MMKKKAFIILSIVLSRTLFAKLPNDTIKDCSKHDGVVVVKRIKGVKKTYQIDSTLFVIDDKAPKEFLKIFEKGFLTGKCFIKRHSGNVNFWGEYYEWKNVYKYGKPPYIGNFKGTYIMVSKPKIIVNKETGNITYSFSTYYCYGSNTIFDDYELTLSGNVLKNERIKIISLVYTGTPI